MYVFLIYVIHVCGNVISKVIYLFKTKKQKKNGEILKKQNLVEIVQRSRTGVKAAFPHPRPHNVSLVVGTTYCKGVSVNCMGPHKCYFVAFYYN